MSKIRIAALLAGCVIAVFGLAIPAPAFAAPSAPNSARAGAEPAAVALITGRSDFCDSYVCGSGTFTDSNNKRRLTGSMSVRFPCGKGLSFARVRLAVGTPTSTQYGAWREITQCGQYVRFGNLVWNQTRAIYAWSFQATRSGGGIGVGNWVYI